MTMNAEVQAAPDLPPEPPENLAARLEGYATSERSYTWAEYSQAMKEASDALHAVTLWRRANPTAGVRVAPPVEKPIGYISQIAVGELQDPNAPDNPLTLRHSKSVHPRAEVPVYLHPAPAPTSDDPIGDFQAEARQAKFNEMAREWTAPVAGAQEKLPPLPEPLCKGMYVNSFTDDQMQDHARAAYAMGRASAVRDYVSLNDAALAAAPTP
ncbi:MAG: hypothetical protein JWQ01_4801 [Massilia sp.]|nr:hypothetical protein [Massilia sp.]